MSTTFLLRFCQTPLAPHFYSISTMLLPNAPPYHLLLPVYCAFAKRSRTNFYYISTTLPLNTPRATFLLHLRYASAKPPSYHISTTFLLRFCQTPPAPSPRPSPNQRKTPPLLCDLPRPFSSSAPASAHLCPKPSAGGDRETSPINSYGRFGIHAKKHTEPWGREVGQRS